MNDRDPGRAAFEAWCVQRWRGDRNALDRNHDDDAPYPGEYTMGTVEFAWQAWQNARPKRAAVGAVMNDLSAAVADVVNERARQVEYEGWTEQHDDAHSDGELAAAAACYANPDPSFKRSAGKFVPSEWPWAAHWWKPKDRRQDLVRAAALILAEIERLDRAAPLAAAVT